jgi:hypothetical protein
MSSYDPIVGTGDFPEFNLFGSRPTVEPGVALVVFTDKGDVLALMPGQRLTAGDIAWKNYKGYFKVDIGVHNLEFKTKVPCNRDAFNFEATLQVTYLVDNPAEIVKNKIRDVLTVLKPEIENRMRTISRKYNAEQSEEAEQEINKSFGKGLRVSGIFASHIVSNLELESAAREHLRTIQSTRNEIERQGILHELEITRSKHDLEIKQLKKDFYAPIVKRDQWELLALHLAEHPDDVATVASMISQQQFEMLKLMLDKDVIEGFHVEDVGKQVLQRLADSFGPLSTKALTDSSSKDAPEKPVNKKRKKKPSKESAEISEEVSNEDDGDE